MKASFNNKTLDASKQVTLKMSLAEFYILRGAMRDLTTEGAGHVSTKTRTENAKEITLIALNDEIEMGLNFPKIEIDKNGRYYFLNKKD